MNKSEIVAKLAAENNMTQRQAAEVLESTLEILFDAAVDDGVARVGTHVFEAKVSQPRTCRNPHTGETVEVPSKTRIKYRRTGGFLKEFDELRAAA